MFLTVMDRILLLQSLPQEGSIVTLKILQNLKSQLSFDEEETKLYEIKENGQTVTWNPDIQQEKEIEIGEKATDMIVKALREMDRSEKLTDNHLPLWAKFIGE